MIRCRPVPNLVSRTCNCLCVLPRVQSIESRALPVIPQRRPHSEADRRLLAPALQQHGNTESFDSRPQISSDLLDAPARFHSRANGPQNIESLAPSAPTCLQDVPCFFVFIAPPCVGFSKPEEWHTSLLDKATGNSSSNAAGLRRGKYRKVRPWGLSTPVLGVGHGLKWKSCSMAAHEKSENPGSPPVLGGRRQWPSEKH